MNKLDVIFEKILSANSGKEEKFNYIIIPVAVFNIIEQHSSFKSIWNSGEERGPYHVGYLGTMHCFVDIFLPPDQIIMKYDKQTCRENKLTAILNGSEITNEVLIKIEDSFY